MLITVDKWVEYLQQAIAMQTWFNIIMIIKR
ncbi:Uncharacterised protein [Vibrio cholerae]|nr:Uncharacterised protein [Vibrio cholerae]CSI93645.1 Uncharacterised protein [Vibrio cholerae]